MANFVAQYWVQVALGLVVTGLGVSFKRLRAADRGMRALLRDRIVQSYNYWMEKKYCPIYAMESINEMYVQYHALGGNGTITELNDRIKELPTEKSKPRAKTQKKETQ